MAGSVMSVTTGGAVTFSPCPPPPRSDSDGDDNDDDDASSREVRNGP